MAGVLSVIQLYPVLGKIMADVSNIWQNKDGSARERVLQHKIDDLLLLLRAHAVPARSTREVATQTESESPVRNKRF